MKRKTFALQLIAAAALLLGACAGATTGAAPTQSSPTQTPGQKVTASGFVCPEPNPRVEVTSREVNLFVWTEYIPQDSIDCFELVYGIKINRDEFSSAEEMYAKLSKGNTSYDVAHVSDNVVAPSIRQGLLQKLDKGRLPIIANFDPQYLDLTFDPGNLYTLPYQAGTDAIVVNTAKVPDPPRSWADLWKPEFRSRIVSIDDSRALIGVALLTLGYDINTTDRAELDQAGHSLAQLVKNVKLFDSDSPKTALIAGDVDLGVVFTGEAVLAQRENPAIQYVYPTEGAILWQDNWAIPTGAPHLDAAYAWLNYSLQGDLFWLMLRDFPYTNPNMAALQYAKSHEPGLYKAYMDSPITNTPPDAFRKGHRIFDVGEALPLYDKIWTEVKGGS